MAMIENILVTIAMIGICVLIVAAIISIVVMMIISIIGLIQEVRKDDK